MRSGSLTTTRDALTTVVVVVALVLVASGCSSSSDPRDWPIATYTNVPDNGSSLMGMTGELRKVDGCVVIVGPDGQMVLPVFRTPGTTWSSGKVRLDDKTLKPGESANFDGGGSLLPDSFIPPACSAITDYFAVYTFTRSK